MNAASARSDRLLDPRVEETLTGDSFRKALPVRFTISWRTLIVFELAGDTLISQKQYYTFQLLKSNPECRDDINPPVNLSSSLGLMFDSFFKAAPSEPLENQL